MILGDIRKDSETSGELPLTYRSVTYICVRFMEGLLTLVTAAVRQCHRNKVTLRRPGLLLLNVTRHYMVQGTQLVI